MAAVARSLVLKGQQITVTADDGVDVDKALACVPFQYVVSVTLDTRSWHVVRVGAPVISIGDDVTLCNRATLHPFLSAPGIGVTV